MGSTMANILVILGRNVRYWRYKRRYSQEALAHITNCHVRTIVDIESGKRNISLDLLGRLCAALDVSPTQLLSFPKKSKPA